MYRNWERRNSSLFAYQLMSLWVHYSLFKVCVTIRDKLGLQDSGASAQRLIYLVDLTCKVLEGSRWEFSTDECNCYSQDDNNADDVPAVGVVCIGQSSID